MSEQSTDERKRRTVRRAVLLVLLALLFIAGIVFAETWDRYPSPFSGHEYTHRIPMRFYLNDGIQTHYFGWMQVPTFDIPGERNTGLSAAVISEVQSVAPDLARDYFEAFHWPTEKGYYMLSAQGGSWGEKVLFLKPEFTKYIQGIRLTREESAGAYAQSVGAYKASDGTKQNPAVFPANNSGPRPSFPADVTWDGKYFAYAKMRLPHVPGAVGNDQIEAGWTELTRPDGARSVAWSTDQMLGYGQVMVSYPHNVAVTGLTLEQAAKKAGDKEVWSVNWINQTPWGVPKAQLRAYTQERGKQPVMVAQQEIKMGTPWDQGTVGSWNFTCPASTADYDVIVTVNKYYQGGSWVEEPLAVRNPNTGQYVLYGAAGLKETIYTDNMVSKGMTGAPVQPPPVQIGTNDLSVTDLKVLDSNKNPVGTTLEEGRTYYVRATFQSGFDVGGFATIRLYRYDASQKRLYDQGSEYAYFSPKGTVTKDFGSFGWGAGSYTLIATVDYYNSGNDPSTGWKTEKFDGKYNESTYDNNRKDLGIGLSEAPPYEPQPGYWSQSVWYPPVKEENVPVYRKEKQYVWRNIWIGPVPVEFEKAEGKITVRLAPNSPPSAPGD